MAKLAAVLSSLDGVPEAVRGFYTQQDDQYVLDADVEAHPSLTNLKSAHQRQKDANTELKNKLRTLEAVDPEEYERLKTFEADLKKRGKGKGKGKDASDDDADPDVDKIIEKRVAEALAEVKPTLDEAEKLRAENTQLKLRKHTAKAALDAGILPEALDDALAASEGHMELKDGKVIVHDEDGHPTGWTLDKFFAEIFKKQKPYYYAAKHKAGSGQDGGSGGGGGASGTLTGDDLMKLEPMARMALGRAGQK